MQVPADEGKLPQRGLRKDSKLEGQLREEHRGVVVAEVVGGVDGQRTAGGAALGGFNAAKRLQLLETFNTDRRKCEAQQNASPQACDEVLMLSGAVPQARDERDGSEERRREGDERQQKQIGEPAQREGYRVYGDVSGRGVLLWLQDLVRGHRCSS